MRNKLTVLGAGSWGTALALLAAKNGHDVLLWGHDPAHILEIEATKSNENYLPGVLFPDNLKVTANLENAVGFSKTLILAIPSQFFADVIWDLKPYLKEHHQFIIATKGLDPSTGSFLTEVVATLSSFPIPVAILSGPTFAVELAEEQPSATALACLSEDLITDAMSFLHANYFRIYPTHDMKGVQLGGVVKNILAIAAGIAEGLGFKANTQAALLTRGLAEMVRLGLAIGGKEETFLGLAGVGDLMLTASNNQSRNRRFGLLLGQGVDITTAERQIHQVVEGMHNAVQICQLADKFHVDMPITRAVNRILLRMISPKEAVHELLMREPKREGV